MSFLDINYMFKNNMKFDTPQSIIDLDPLTKKSKQDQNQNSMIILEVFKL